MQRILLILLLAFGYIGFRFSRDFTPSTFHFALSAFIALFAFIYAKRQWQDNEKGYNPTTIGGFTAFLVFVCLLFPVGKAMTHVFGKTIERNGVVASYHESRGRRSRQGNCRHQNDIRLTGNDSVTVCGFELPRGMPVRVSMMSSAFGRYSEQLAGQVDLAGFGSVNDIVQRADKAREEADMAVKEAKEAQSSLLR